MSDIVERLRAAAPHMVGSCEMIVLAADTITTLRAEVERLRGALKYALPIVEKYGWTQGDNPAFHAELTAPIRAALAQEKQ